jgi:hypothetical protein
MKHILFIKNVNPPLKYENKYADINIPYSFTIIYVCKLALDKKARLLIN